MWKPNPRSARPVSTVSWISSLHLQARLSHPPLHILPRRLVRVCLLPPLLPPLSVQPRVTLPLRPLPHVALCRTHASSRCCQPSVNLKSRLHLISTLVNSSQRSSSSGNCVRPTNGVRSTIPTRTSSWTPEGGRRWYRRSRATSRSSPARRTCSFRTLHCSMRWPTPPTSLLYRSSALPTTGTTTTATLRSVRKSLLHPWWITHAGGPPVCPAVALRERRPT
jgi:hypothetical protein